MSFYDEDRKSFSNENSIVVPEEAILVDLSLGWMPARTRSDDEIVRSSTEEFFPDDYALATIDSPRATNLPACYNGITSVPSDEDRSWVILSRNEVMEEFREDLENRNQLDKKLEEIRLEYENASLQYRKLDDERHSNQGNSSCNLGKACVIDAGNLRRSPKPGTSDNIDRIQSSISDDNRPKLDPVTDTVTQFPANATEFNNVQVKPEQGNGMDGTEVSKVYPVADNSSDFCSEKYLLPTLLEQPVESTSTPMPIIKPIALRTKPVELCNYRGFEINPSGRLCVGNCKTGDSNATGMVSEAWDIDPLLPREMDCSRDISKSYSPTREAPQNDYRLRGSKSAENRSDEGNSSLCHRNQVEGISLLQDKITENEAKNWEPHDLVTGTDKSNVGYDSNRRSPGEIFPLLVRQCTIGKPTVEGIDYELINFFTRDCISPSSSAQSKEATQEDTDHEVANIMAGGSDDYVIDFKSDSSNEWTVSSAGSDVIMEEFVLDPYRDIQEDVAVVPSTSPEYFEDNPPEVFPSELNHGDSHGTDDVDDKTATSALDKAPLNVIESSPMANQTGGDQSHDNDMIMDDVRNIPVIELPDEESESSLQTSQYSTEAVPVCYSNEQESSDRPRHAFPKRPREIDSSPLNLRESSVSLGDIRPAYVDPPLTIVEAVSSETLLRRLPSVPHLPPGVREPMDVEDTRRISPGVSHSTVGVTLNKNGADQSKSYPEVDVFAKARMRRGGLHRWEMNCLLTALSREQEECDRLARDSKRAADEYLQVKKEVDRLLTAMGERT